MRSSDAALIIGAWVIVGTVDARRYKALMTSAPTYSRRRVKVNIRERLKSRLITPAPTPLVSGAGPPTRCRRHDHEVTSATDTGEPKCRLLSMA